MTKWEWIEHANTYEAMIEELAARGEDGSDLEYLHHKANACRARAAEAEEE